MCPPAKVVTHEPWWRRALARFFGPPLPILTCGKCGGVMAGSPRKPGCCRGYLLCHGPHRVDAATVICMTTEVYWS